MNTTRVAAAPRRAAPRQARDRHRWCQAVRALYDNAQAWLKQHPAASQTDREAEYVRLTGQSHALGLRYAQMKGHPCKALCQRLLRHEDELFQFVLVDGLSADNNQAERSIRPLVIIRKISGGSRSDAVVVDKDTAHNTLLQDTSFRVL